MLFNIILLVHFLCFSGYLWTLASLWKNYDTQARDHKGLILGILLLVTGCLLVTLKYPHVNYYKVAPKTGMFLAVTLINIRFGNKPYTRQAYYALIALTVAAACIAVVKW
ncbi:hypothetical protein [Chitinophaga sp. 212800010-3]|uniref:hypothetical protein n=1 Tax=unclassified Chitinophaga TaxID=2619133 RepID=UPI002DF4E671|nr:Fe-S protein [Chitinophaga sp. 212800010-3]